MEFSQLMISGKNGYLEQNSNLIRKYYLEEGIKRKEKILALYKMPSIVSVQGMSREESLAFIISCFISNPDKEEDFFSRSIIVDNVDAFRELSIHKKPLILVPRFEIAGFLTVLLTTGIQ